MEKVVEMRPMTPRKLLRQVALYCSSFKESLHPLWRVPGGGGVVVLIVIFAKWLFYVN
jgi:hypothetical protein